MECRNLELGFRVDTLRCQLPMARMKQLRCEVPDIVPATDPALRAIAMPADTNPHGDIFGGWLLCQMDLAGLSIATRAAKGRVVTVAITGMAFHRPVCVGDEVSCFGSLEKIGNTSLTLKIESWVRRGVSGDQIKVTEGFFTYVAVTADGQSRPVPKE